LLSTPAQFTIDEAAVLKAVNESHQVLDLQKYF
jgi:hypothetical protein